MALRKYVDLGLDIQYDVSRTKANESTISVGKFKNLEYNLINKTNGMAWSFLSFLLDLEILVLLKCMVGGMVARMTRFM